MVRFIAWRLIQLPLIVAIIFAVTFTLAWIIPGDPLARIDGPRPPEEIQQAMREQYGLTSPWVFAGRYLRDVFTRGDFGPSLHYRDQRVSNIIAQRLPVSAMLGVTALFLAMLVGVGTGVIGALKPGSSFDSASLIIALVGVSLPAFVTGTLLLIIFAALLQWLPVGGWGTPAHLLLPAITLAAAPAAYIARLTRLGLADVMTSDFIRTARAKGLSHRQAVFNHALKVAFLPVLSFLGPAAAIAMTGSFVVEKVFTVPGLGSHFIDAVLHKDQFLILGIVLVYSVMLIVFNLMVDIAYAWVDPRIDITQ